MESRQTRGRRAERHGDAGGAEAARGTGPLIAFDRRVITFLALLACCFTLFVALDLNMSSIGRWDLVVPPPGGCYPGLLLGEPREIRRDEWLVTVPFVFSQAEHGYPLENRSIGAHADPLLISVPVRHFSALFRPQNWGYFVLGVERGFSFYWGFKIFALTASFFLLLLMITRNRFWIALGGTAWLLFSSYIQWWFSTTIPEMLTAFSVLAIALAYLLVSRRPATMAAAALVSVFFAVDFVLFFYPPFQVLLGYLLLAVLAGIIAGGYLPAVRENLARRLGFMAGALLLVVLALALFYRDAAATIAAISATVYPGRRVAAGGTVGLVRLFSGFTLVPYGEGGFPPAWSNASEASGFVFLFPAVLAALAGDVVRRRRVGPLVAALAAFTVIVGVWILWGLPAPLAKLTLLDLVPADRAIFGLGVGNIMLVVAYLGAGRPARARDRLFQVLLAMVSFLLLLSLGSSLKHAAPDLFHPYLLVAMAPFFAIVVYLLLRRRSTAFFVLLLAVSVAFTAGVNPLYRGVAALRDKEEARVAASLAAADPGARWVAYGNNTLASFLKANGLEVVNGYQYTPDLDFFAALDPSGGYAEIYNRYANISFQQPAAANTGERFTLIYRDAFSVNIDPCAPELAALGIDYFAFSYRPDPGTIGCLEPVGDYRGDTIGFYRRRQ